MPTFSWDTSLAAMLDQTGPSADTPAGMRPVAEALEALRAAPMSDELASEGVALAEFRDRFGPSRQPDRPRRRKPAPWLSARAAAAAALAALTLGGAAAYADVLPGAVQRLAHDAIGAPAPGRPASPRPERPRPASHRPVRGGTPVGPEATGSAAHGQCMAYEHAWSQGDNQGRTVAFRNLAAAAGGQGNIQAYCSRVLSSKAAARHRPGGRNQSSDHSGSHHQAGKPGARPPAHPATRTASLPAGGPSSDQREVRSH